MAVTDASAHAKAATYIGRATSEIVATASMTNAEAATFLGESEVALSRAPALVAPQAAPPEEGGVPDGTIAEVMEWVGDDPVRAQQALDVENAAETPRSTLISQLEAIING